MKKIIMKRLCMVIIISMIVGIGINYDIQLKDARKVAYTNYALQLKQIEKILEGNERDLIQLEDGLREDYFIRAKAAAYIIQNKPEVVEDLLEMRKVASLLQVDELHVFSPEGVLYAGSEPKYYGMTFNSGEQMQFFLPILEDTSLQLCQEVTPNTAEGKLMQYLAVWREDKEEIIQIGMEPIRLIEAMEQNELSYIFNRIPTEEGVSIFALDTEMGKVMGTTSAQLWGKSAQDIGLPVDKLEVKGDTLETQLKIEGKQEYCVARRAGNVIICISCSREALYRRVAENMWLVSLSLLGLGMLITFLIYRMLNAYIIQGIQRLTDGMGIITQGDLDYRIAVDSTPEFTELSGNINNLVGSLLKTTSKLSLIFESVDIPVAAYECHKDMRRVLVTSKFREILGLSEAELHDLLEDREEFARYIGELCRQPYGKDIYVLPGVEPRYIRYRFYHEKGDVLGAIVDVTEDIRERQRIEQERDVDVLTGLYSRRAFFKQMDRLFEKPEALEAAVLMMADMDRLKQVNDTYGHKYGDRILKEAATLLQDCKAPHRIAARLSGDEFALFLYGAASREELQEYLEELKQRMKAKVMAVTETDSVPVRLSGGYVFYPSYSDNYRELLRMADKALYLAKKAHCGEFEEYRKEMEPESESR